MRRLTITTLLVLSGSGCLVAAAMPQYSSGCRPADEVRAPANLAYFHELLTSADTERVRVREAFGLAPASANKISLVTNRRICESAAEALNEVIETPGVSRQVWVYKLGNGFYGVEDPDLPHPDINLFTSDWVYMATLVEQ